MITSFIACAGMMPDEGNLDPGCSRLHHDEYETSGASSCTSSRPTLNQMERQGWSLGRMRNMNAVRDNGSTGKKDIHQEWKGTERVWGQKWQIPSKTCSTKGTSALTTSFERLFLDFCHFTNNTRSNKFTLRNSTIFCHFQGKLIQMPAW